MNSIERVRETAAGSRIERIYDDLELPGTEILQLFRPCFGEVDSLWPANRRWLLWSPDRLVGHVSVQRRWFVVNGRHFEGWFVGGVCVDPVLQGRGLGTLLMRQAHAVSAGVREGVLKPGGMPPAPWITDEALDDMRHYLRSRARQAGSELAQR